MKNDRITADHPRTDDTLARACELCHQSAAHKEKIIQSIATPFSADIILHELNEARKIEATIANKDTSSHLIHCHRWRC